MKNALLILAVLFSSAVAGLCDDVTNKVNSSTTETNIDTSWPALIEWASHGKSTVDIDEKVAESLGLPRQAIGIPARHFSSKTTGARRGIASGRTNVFVLFGNSQDNYVIWLMDRKGQVLSAACVNPQVQVQAVSPALYEADLAKAKDFLVERMIQQKTAAQKAESASDTNRVSN